MVNGHKLRSLGDNIGASEKIYTARVVVKTNESPYVDGMEGLFKVKDDELKIDPLYYENHRSISEGK